MRCHICDAGLSPDEIEFEHDHGNFAPCFVCRKASEDTPDYDMFQELVQYEEAIIDPDDLSTTNPSIPL